MKKLIPVAFFALLALNTNVINAANSTGTIKVADQPIENRLNEKETSKLNKENMDIAPAKENLVSNDSSSKMNDSSALTSSDNAGIYISSGAALIIIIILLIILL